MTLSATDLMELGSVACDAANAAARLIARSRPTEVRSKPGEASEAAQLVSDVDQASERLLLEHLAPSMDRFGIGMLTEEQPDDGSRRLADAFWCIDPLDGTLPYVEGQPGFAVSVALVARDGQPLVGVVHDPTTGIVRHAIRGGGAYRNGEAWMRPTPHSATPLMVFADRSFLAHPSADQTMIDLEQVAGDLGRPGVRVETGAGAVMNACQVLDHSPACYLKLPVARGGGSLWDFAATACLFHELGAVATDSGGRALDLNRRERTSMGHRGVLFASDADLASRLRTITPRS